MRSRLFEFLFESLSPRLLVPREAPDLSEVRKVGREAKASRGQVQSAHAAQRPTADHQTVGWHHQGAEDLRRVFKKT